MKLIKTKTENNKGGRLAFRSFSLSATATAYLVGLHVYQVDGAYCFGCTLQKRKLPLL